MNPESQAKVHFGLANRRLQPLGHLSNGRNPYSFEQSTSNRSRDSGDSADSGDSGEVAKEITGPSPTNRLKAQENPQNPAQDAGSPRPPPRRRRRRRRSQKESHPETANSNYRPVHRRAIQFPLDVLKRLEAHAAPRRTTPNELARRIVEIVLDEDLIRAVLDDAS